MNPTERTGECQVRTEAKKSKMCDEIVPEEVPGNDEVLHSKQELTKPSFTVDHYIRGDDDVNVCESVLDNKLIHLEYNQCNSALKCSEILKVNGDGSDSGIEFGVNGINGGIQICALQRALSSNSGGYSSSCGGLEEAPGMISCDSSMISYCSDMFDSIKPIKLNGGGGGTSEGGSESSSVTGGPVSMIRSKKKVGVVEPASKPAKRYSNESNGSKGRSSSVNRITPTKVTPPAATRDRARSRDKIPPKTPTTSRTAQSSKSSRPPKPDSFPVEIKDPASPAIQRIRGSRTPSITRGRTPGTTPTDDGRWPSIGSKGGGATPKSTRGLGIMTESLTIKTRAGPIALENSSKSSPLDKYATLPRRRKEKSADEIKDHTPRSSSITRESRVTPKKTPAPLSSTPSKTLPPYIKPVSSASKKPPLKVKIYHETAIQTAITLKDVEDAFSGVAKQIKVDACETANKSSQSDIRDREIEQLRETIKKLSNDFTHLQATLSEKTQTISQMEHELIQEREDKLAAQKELHANSERVLAMLESVHVPAPNSTDTDGGGDSLLILESQIIKSEHILEKQEVELSKWKNICSRLQNDMEKSLRTQRNLIQQREIIELESTELQDFLQAEKATLTDSLREIERDVDSYRQRIIKKDSDLERLQEECRHLVRISEQRRQESLGLQSKYTALESRSRELVLQHSAAVSGASCALTGLGTRIDHLVEQLIVSYSISEQELEDAIYHNEAYTNSGSSGEGSPESDVPQHGTHDGSVSPQRGHSFIAAVINAIRNATTSTRTAVASSNRKSIVTTVATTKGGEDDSDATEMLDSETEPCLMMENVLEDVTLPDSHSHNMVSSTSAAGSVVLSQIEMPSDMKHHGGDSLHNLSQAIENRQQMELQSCMLANRSVQQSMMSRQQSEQSCTSDDVSVHESVAEIPSITDYYLAQSIVDQVIDVDNMVTKLLKVLRIIQMDNENCIQHLICDKNKLQLSKEEMLEQIRVLDEINHKLKDDLTEASQNILLRGDEIANSKIELQRHRIEIDRLNEDICNLSTLCSQKLSNKKLPPANGSPSIKNDFLAILKSWEENGAVPEPDIITHIITACNEIPVLQEQLSEKERLINDMTSNLSTTKHLMTSSWHNAVSEAKRQYEAIDRALETLNSIQSIVQKCPALAQLQRDLEETNFQSATSLPIATALLSSATNGGGHHNNANETEDLNANGNGNSNEGATSSPRPIDSAA